MDSPKARQNTQRGKGHPAPEVALEEQLEEGGAREVQKDASFEAWFFVNARITFEGLIDCSNSVVLHPRAFYLTEEASLTMVFPGQGLHFPSWL